MSMNSDDKDMIDMFGGSDSESSDAEKNPETDFSTSPLTHTPQQEAAEFDQDMLDMFGGPSDDEDEVNNTKLVTSNGTNHTSTATTSSYKEELPKTPGPSAATMGCIPKRNSGSSTTNTTTSRLMKEETAQEKKRRRVADAILAKNQKVKLSAISTNAATPAKKKPTQNMYYRSVEMDHYWKNILEWNFIKDLNESQQRNSSPIEDGSHIDSSKKNAIEPLPDTFASTQEYKARWSPLLLQEVKSQVLSELSSNSAACWARGGGMAPVLVEPVASTASTTSNTIALLIRTQSTAVSVLGDDSDGLFVNDMLVFVPDSRSLFDAAQGKLVVENPIVGTDVQKPKNRLGILGLSLNSCKKTLDGLKVKVSLRQWQAIGKRDMFLAKVGSNITSLREFTALCRMECILLKNVLLSGKAPRQTSTDDLFGDLLSEGGGEKALGVGFRIYVKSKFNPSQIRAITAAASEYGSGGFTLVKGPPGTGKTTTLVAMLNALHLRQYQIYYQEIERIATQETSDDISAMNAAARVKPRILVCAPSNAAVDNVILKITTDRFVDGNGGRYSPSIVRVGARQSTKVNNVSLQTQMDAILAEGTDQVKLEHLIKFAKAELKRFHQEIKQLKQRLRALVEACPLPLSQDWEIRIDEENFEQTRRVLFVNHRLKQTTLKAPSPAAPGEESHSAVKMPHYRSLMDSLVKYVERHNSMTYKLKEYKLVQATNQCITRDGRYSRSALTLMEDLETHLINTSHICLTTLGSAGSKKIQSAQKFEVVVVDEAAQSSEPATLVALELGSSHAVLMGDPQQLPATIFSLSGRCTKYDRSLFQRLEEAGHPVHMLDTQYRMDPAISDFPRRIFYDGRLLDGANVKNPQYGGVLRKTVTAKFPHFKAFTILDLDSAEERDGTSLANTEEVDLALHLYCTLERETCGMISKCQVAVITPYSQQAALLKQRFTNHFGASNRMPVEISTIDAFQGKEADIVIFSCVRAAGGGGGIGFLSDVKRMNVALTRAKHYMFVIANIRTIVVNPYWKDLVEHARERRSVIPVPIANGFNHVLDNTKLSNGNRARKNLPSLTILQPMPPKLATHTNHHGTSAADFSDSDVSA